MAKKKVKRKATATNAESAAPATATATNSSSSEAMTHADQPDLPGMESDRLPVIETTVKKIVEKQSVRKALKEEIDGLFDKLTSDMRKHERNQYSCHGKKVVIIPGADEVRLKKAKSQ
jgi:hypothetical protein